jgi:hypothetical protein
MKKVTYLLIAMHSPLWFNIAINQATAQPGRKPPPEAIYACQNKPVNAQCDFFGPKGQEFGFCENTPNQAFFACRPDKNADVNIPVNFTLTSSTMSDEHLLSETNTCDGESISPPLSWKNAPAGTTDYAVIMHHEVAVNDNHWYWVMYDEDMCCQGCNLIVSIYKISVTAT